MLFNSFEFLFFFLPVTVAAIYGSRRLKAFQLAQFILIAASLVFYAWWDWRFVGLLLGSTILNWFCGWFIANAKSRHIQAIAVTAGVAADLLVLIFFKYRLLFSDALSLSLSQRSSVYVWILPLGISFWTFEQIIYLVDCYRRQQRALKFKDYLAFVTFFPRLIAGPIIRPRDFFKSYDHWRERVPADFIAAGLTLMAIGLFKKMCLADQLGSLANPIFKLADDGYAVSFRDAWIGSLGFTYQIYFDFSGYSDIAIGLALLFGIRLPPNFDAPYKSRSIVEFWRRWHISLSTFLRDYLYIPLGGNRKGHYRQVINIMITMGLGGLWHGAGINFLIWGLLHGCYVALNHLIAPVWRTDRGIWRLIAWTATFLAVTVTWVFFRADSFQGAMRVIFALAGLRTGPNTAVPLGGPVCAALLAYSTFHCLYLPSSRVLFARYLATTVERPELATGFEWRSSLAWALLSGALASAAIWLMLEDRREFIYFQF